MREMKQIPFVILEWDCKYKMFCKYFEIKLINFILCGFLATLHHYTM